MLSSLYNLAGSCLIERDTLSMVAIVVPNGDSYVAHPGVKNIIVS